MFLAERSLTEIVKESFEVHHESQAKVIPEVDSCLSAKEHFPRKFISSGGDSRWRTVTESKGCANRDSSSIKLLAWQTMDEERLVKPNS